MIPLDESSSSVITNDATLFQEPFWLRSLLFLILAVTMSGNQVQQGDPNREISCPQAIH